MEAIDFPDFSVNDFLVLCKFFERDADDLDKFVENEVIQSLDNFFSVSESRRTLPGAPLSLFSSEVGTGGGAARGGGATSSSSSRGGADKEGSKLSTSRRE